MNNSNISKVATESSYNYFILIADIKIVKTASGMLLVLFSAMSYILWLHFKS